MMNTITATGNNFGAGDIQFRSFQQTNLLILNAEVEFDPSNPTYQAAEQLEIYVPDLPLERSVASGMLMFGTQGGEKNGTVVKAWIQDRNTIAVEKVTAWDDNDTVTLVFSNSFVPRNVKAAVTGLSLEYAIAIDAVGTLTTGQAYWTSTDEWVFLAVTFSSMKQADFDTEVSFKLMNLPEIEDFDGIMMESQAYEVSVGTRMYRFQIRNNVFSIEKFSTGSYLKTIQRTGFICYVPKKTVQP